MNDKIEGPQRELDEFLEPMVSRDKRESIGRDAKLAAIALSAIVFVGQQFLLSTEAVKKRYAPVGDFFEPGAASLGDYVSIWDTFMAAAPLIIVFAIFYVYLQRVLQGQAGLGPGHFGVGALLLILAAWFGNAAGFAPVGVTALGGNPYVMLVRLLSDYFTSYGAILFLSSIVVGIFIGRAWETLHS